MFSVCKACGARHKPWMRCEVAARMVQVLPVEEVPAVVPATNKQPVVVNTVVNAAMVVNTESDVVVNARTKDRHRNTAERKAYVRAKMRESRARKRASRVSGGSS